MKTGTESGLAFAAALALALFATGAEPVRDVELADGSKLKAIVIPASHCPVIVQSEDVCLEVPLEKIRRIDGSPDVAEALRSKRPPLLRNETFDELQADGSVVMRSGFERRNASTGTVHEIDWGIAPHEIPLLVHWRVFDELGNELTVRLEDRANGAKHAYARLVRPILPGETIRFTTEILFPDRLARTEEGLSYRSVGDYPEDRLVTKMVRLPEGAEIVRVSPEPAQRFDADGVPYVVWRRYYAAGEETPLEVVFRPAGS